MKIASLLFAMACFIAPTAAIAQEPPPTAQAPSAESQALMACVVRNTTTDDSIVLMRWMFVGIARHPSISQMASISDAERVDANRQMGALFNRILLDNCSNETRAALQVDRAHAMGFAFRALGSHAMSDFMGNPDVSSSISDVLSYIDQRRFAEIVGNSR
ncbi:MAG: hypothetical protein HY054_15200 [Proteobacteria bacterium]|nr:hypothetical protein [Pseudomonadota bacterium]